MMGNDKASPRPGSGRQRSRTSRLYRFEGSDKKGSLQRTLKTSYWKSKKDEKTRKRKKRRKKQIRLKEDQAKKSTGRMPRHRTPKKDVVSCEKLWGAANRP